MAARLRRHEASHSGVRPFKCPICEYTSNRRSNVPLHVRKKHKQHCSHGDVIVLEDEMEKYKKMFPNTEVRSKARIST